MITNNHEQAESFNTFFSNITQNLKIDSNLVENTQNLNTSDPVLKAIKKFLKTPKYHQSKRKDEEQEYVLFLVLLLRKQF